MLDLGLPDLDGADVLALIRATSDVPVVIATARDDEREIVRLLDAGADDYLIKPFSAGQAMARIRAVLRRTAPTTLRTRGSSSADLVIDPVVAVGAARGPRADAEPQGVRPAARARLAARRGRQQAPAAGRGVADAVGRRGPHGRRPPVLAAPQARGDRGRAALPAQCPRGRGQARRPRDRDEPARPDPGADGRGRDRGPGAVRGPAGRSCCTRPAARGRPRQHATDVAQGVADYVSAGTVEPSALRDYVDRINDRNDSYPVEVALPDGTSVGAQVPGFDEADPDGDGSAVRASGRQGRRR